MAFPIDEVTYGTGAVEEVMINAENKWINSYAHVTKISGTTITIDTGTAYVNGYESFSDTNAEVLFHVSASAGADTKYLGKWKTGKITKRAVNVLTVDFDPTEIIPAAELSKYHCQLIVIPRFTSLTIGANTSISPPQYDPDKMIGGIVALKCSDTLTLNGGHIDLRECGIPTNSKALRPLTQQEQQGTLDTDKYSGWENSHTKERLLLNCGDGAAFIVAKKLVVSNAASRIGEVTTAGVQFCRGASDSYDLPSGVTNIGGSTILIAAGSITTTVTDKTVGDILPAIIAKYRLSNKNTTAGQGLARCYIASGTKLRNDEGLYAYDCLHDPTKLTSSCNIRDFGNGSDASTENVTRQLNNYATVKGIDGAKVTYTGKTTEGLAPIKPGALVMFHVMRGQYQTYDGRFFLARVLDDDGTTLTLNKQVNQIFSNTDNAITAYHAQIISIPQYVNFTLSTENSATMQFDGEKGGIFAVACKGTCDLSGGTINVEGKGGGHPENLQIESNPYGFKGLENIGNAQDNNKLPIGQGHGSVFILAKNLTMNKETRIGASYSGANFGGNGSHTNSQEDEVCKGGGYSGTPRKFTATSATGGSGAPTPVALSQASTSVYYGGYGSNGYHYGKENASYLATGRQGAHIMIIADTITGFNQAAISTGGSGGKGEIRNGISAGAGYGGGGGWALSPSYNFQNGGGGGYNGGGMGGKVSGGFGFGGGSSGWAFIWCNNVVNQDTTDTVLFD